MIWRHTARHDWESPLEGVAVNVEPSRDVTDAFVQVEAWQTCHSLLTGQDTPLEGRLFAAQTIRSKVRVSSSLLLCFGAI